MKRSTEASGKRWFTVCYLVWKTVGHKMDEHPLEFGCGYYVWIGPFGADL